jgi:hypothetical protein
MDGTNMKITDYNDPSMEMLWLELVYFSTCVIEVANTSKDSVVFQLRISGGHEPQMLNVSHRCIK